MACDTAFRIVARRHLDALNANHEATCKGDPNALHQMRLALTHLRTAILFFSPMVHDAVRDEVRDELKWLNGELGTVRDLDVAEIYEPATEALAEDPGDADTADRLRAFAARLRDELRSAAAMTSWRELSQWCLELFTALLGDADALQRLPAEEQYAAAAVRKI